MPAAIKPEAPTRLTFEAKDFDPLSFSSDSIGYHHVDMRPMFVQPSSLQYKRVPEYLSRYGTYSSTLLYCRSLSQAC